MSEPQTIHLITKTKKGKLIKVPAMIQVVKHRIEFIKSPFALKDEIKAMKGSKWHGYDEKNSRKIWSVADCTRNRFQLNFMMGKNPYKRWEQPLQEFDYERPLFKHQELMANWGLTYHYCILAAEMGCVEGDATVHVNRAGRGFSLSLRELCYKFHGGKTRGRSWSQSTETCIRGFYGDRLGLIKVNDVLLKGVKSVLSLQTESGKHLKVTDDHEICVGAWRYGIFKEAKDLNIGDTIMVAAPNGWASSSGVSQTQPEELPKTINKGKGHWLDKDGYIRIGGLKGHPRWTTGGVYEHILVMEDLLGRQVQYGEEIHHKNGQRWDNRPENLILCTTRADHMARHNCLANLANGEVASILAFTFDRIAAINAAGTTDVYDVVCEGPYHNFVANGLVVHNCGKTLSAIEVMERSGFSDWWWIGPKSGLRAVQREFDKWGLQGIDLQLYTYEALRNKMKAWVPGTNPPHGVVFDESSRLKNHTSQRSQAAQALADGIREAYGSQGYVIEMSGTPSPKSPVDWWSQAEIAAPGFLREGDMKAFEYRLGVFIEKTIPQGTIHQRATWLDDEAKCAGCGGYEDEEQHLEMAFDDDYHQWEPSFNEVAYLKERLEGLVLVLHKKDCLDLPEKIYRTIQCEPTPTTQRVAKALVKIAPNVITGLTWLRELSDGFQYREKVDGTLPCPVCTDGKAEVWIDPDDPDRKFEMVDMLDPEYVETLRKELQECPTCEGSTEIPRRVRVVKEVPCPKDHALVELLEENEEQGRLVIFAGFTGSLDRVVRICQNEKWAVIRVDGRGWKVWDVDGTALLVEKPLDFWADVERHPRVVFVAHPKSGGMSLSLPEARMEVFYSNDFDPESRSQAEDRIHRLGMDENLGATIVDLIHLPTDERVLSILKDNRRLELLTLGEMQGVYGVEEEE